MGDAADVVVNGTCNGSVDVPTYSWPGSGTDSEAERVAALGYIPGIKPTTVRQHYDDISYEYDEYLRPGRYNGPKYAADAVARYFKEQPKIKILDVAAGTGMVAEELIDRGFANVDALDPSTKMIELAKKKNVYKNYFMEFIGQGDSSITADTYDALTVAGGMGEGHIPSSALVDMAKVVKPGGIVVVTLRKSYLNTCTDYRESWDMYLQQLERQGIWEQLENREVPHFAFGLSGLVCVFRVKSEGAPFTLDG